MFLAVIKVNSSLIKWESLYSVIEEEVYRLSVKLENECLQEIDKIVDYLLVSEILGHEVMANQLGHKSIAEQVE